MIAATDTEAGREVAADFPALRQSVAINRSPTLLAEHMTDPYQARMLPVCSGR